ncbi:MAG: o-succinylbenzoate synthase, partial [Solirubrobacterales bacterium]
MRLAVESLSLRFREPVRSAWGDLETRDLLRVRLEAEDGLVGLGEAAPLEPYDGVALPLVRAALDAYAEVLAGCAEADALEACRAE